jgi:hypothetical protein
MSKIKKIIFKFFLLCVVFGFYGVGSFQSTHTNIKHSIGVIHPGVSLVDSLDCTLVEFTKNKYETESNFYMDVESVLCGSKECKVVTVRIFWDELGRYSKFEMQKGAELEKNEGKPFTKEDYLKLDGILKDKKSPLQDFYKHELVDNSHANAADAFSGATVVIDKRATVEGAVWTCYTLWYWANGGVVPVVRKITGKKNNVTQLHRYLSGSNLHYKEFALEQMMQKKIFDKRSLDLVIEKSLASKEIQKMAIDYFEKQNSSVYYNAMEKVFVKANDAQKLLLLDAFLLTDLKPTKVFLDRFCNYFSEPQTYQAVSMMFDLMIRKNKNSEEFKLQALNLLENKNILISRRAYWFLKNCSLTGSQSLLIQEFVALHKDKL